MEGGEFGVVDEFEELEVGGGVDEFGELGVVDDKLGEFEGGG